MTEDTLADARLMFGAVSVMPPAPPSTIVPAPAVRLIEFDACNDCTTRLPLDWVMKRFAKLAGKVPPLWLKLLLTENEPPADVIAPVVCAKLPITGLDDAKLSVPPLTLSALALKLLPLLKVPPPRLSVPPL